MSFSIAGQKTVHTSQPVFIPLKQGSPLYVFLEHPITTLFAVIYSTEEQLVTSLARLGLQYDATMYLEALNVVGLVIPKEKDGYPVLLGLDPEPLADGSVKFVRLTREDEASVILAVIPLQK